MSKPGEGKEKPEEDKAKAAKAAAAARKERAAQLLRELYEMCVSGAVRERKPSDKALVAAQPERDEALESETVYLLKQLGKGSFGTVHAAFWSRKNVLVAVKIMSKSKLSEEALNKFLPRELDNVKACARFSS